jgi:hypothetical protein
VVLFAQLDDEIVRGRFFGLGLGTMARGDKKDRLGLAAEVVAQDVEGIEGVAEGAGDSLGGATLDQESSQGLILAVFGEAGLKEEAAELT